MLLKQECMTGILICIILAVIRHAKSIFYLMHRFCGIIAYYYLCKNEISQRNLRYKEWGFVMLMLDHVGGGGGGRAK